jgi:copper transport protein
MKAHRKRNKKFIGAVGLFAALALLLSPDSAWAHAQLKRSEPAAGTRVLESPKAIHLWFSERPEIRATLVTLTDATGRRFTLGAPEQDVGDPLEVSLLVLESLPEGKYTLSWRTLASDGHPSHGSFGFTVARNGRAAIGTAVSPDTTISIARSADTSAQSPSAPEDDNNEAASTSNSLARAFSFVGLLVVIGATTFRTFVVDRVPSAPAVARARLYFGASALGLGGSVLVVVAAIARIYLESRMMSAEPGMATMSMAEMTMHTQWGFALRLTIVLAVIALVAFAAAMRGARGAWIIAGLSAIALSVTPALAGHAAASATHRPLLIVTDFLHVLGAGSWLGCLLCVMLVAVPTALTIDTVERWPLVATMVNGFSRVALVSVGVVVASGILASWLHLETLSALWTTAYGQVLLVKLLLVAITLSVGAYNFRKVQPQLATEKGTMRLRQSAALELSVAFLVLIVTGFLTGVSP